MLKFTHYAGLDNLLKGNDNGDNDNDDDGDIT